MRNFTEHDLDLCPLSKPSSIHCESIYVGGAYLGPTGRFGLRPSVIYLVFLKMTFKDVYVQL